MQKPILPIQISGASATPARAKSSAPDGGAQFSQNLHRELEQRKVQQAEPANSQPGGPTKQANNADKAGAPKKAAEPARAGQTKAPAKAEGKSAGKDGADDAAAQATAAQQPVAEMLAMMASFNPSGAMAATDGAAGAPSAPGTAALPVDAQLATVQADAGMDQLAANGAALLEGAAAPGQFQQLLAQGDGKPGQGEPALPGLETAGKAGAKVEPALATGTPDPAQLTALRARDALPEAALKDAPVGAPAAAPQLQAALAQAAPAASDKIAARVGSTGWDNQVGQKIVWMVAGKEQSATLTLNPPDMGPMQVVLSVTNDHASVTFSSATPEVRQALEDAMPRLREMMSENGIALGNASVNDGAAQQQQQARDEGAGRAGRGGERGSAGTGASGSASEAEARVAERPARRGELPGLVDTFA